MGRIQLKNFEIVLKDNKNVYQLGEQVIGKCIIALKGELQLSKVHMKLKVKAKVVFSGGRTNFLDEIKYLEIDYNFIHNSFNEIITKGIYEFPFCYQLPNEGIPSSFVGIHGSIKYWIEAEIEKPMFSLNTIIKKDLIVEAPPICYNLMVPLSRSHDKNLGFLNSGNIMVNINIDKKGYIPGQTISMICKIINNSPKCVTPRATLKQIQTYVIKKENIITDTETKCMRVVGQTVNCGLTDVQTIGVLIPPDIQLSLFGCPILSVRYELHVTIDIPSAQDLHLNVPIIITTENVLAKSSPYSCEVKIA